LKVIYCPVDAPAAVCEVPDAYPGIRDLIGGWIEIVRPRLLPPELVMIVDEEGLLKELPINLIGTHLYGITAPTPIVGPVVIAGEGIVDGEPDLIGLTDQQCDDLLSRYLPRLISMRLPDGCDTI